MLDLTPSLQYNVIAALSPHVTRADTHADSSPAEAAASEVIKQRCVGSEPGRTSPASDARHTVRAGLRARRG
eukprot:2166964-Prymnesium_polylepis.1